MDRYEVRSPRALTKLGYAEEQVEAIVGSSPSTAT